MNKTLLKEIILEQSEGLERLDPGVPRENLASIAAYLALPHTVFIAGIRRAGKSTLLRQLMQRFYPEGAYYFNFEDERLLRFQAQDMNDLYECLLEIHGRKQVFFLDEVQNVPGWESFVRRMQDQGFKFFITGSNAALLSKELGTKLTGRYVVNYVYPFSFKEFLVFKGMVLPADWSYRTAGRAAVKRAFGEYLRQGGMPEFLKYGVREVLTHVYEDILYRDIAVRYALVNIQALRELGLYFLTHVAQTFSYNKLKAYLHLGSVNTVKSYTGYLENSFLVSIVNRFSYSLKQQLIANKKVYGVDNGLVDSIAFRFSKEQGRYLENLVFNHLKRRQQEIYYALTSTGAEVDFVLRQGQAVQELIQVTQSLGNEAVKERETRALLQAMQDFGLERGTILTEDEEYQLSLENRTISVRPVYKWLLEETQAPETEK